MPFSPLQADRVCLIGGVGEDLRGFDARKAVPTVFEAFVNVPPRGGTVALMDTYTAQAEVWNADGQLVVAVVAEVERKGDDWKGILTVDAAPIIDWHGQDLILRSTEGHPAGPILVERPPTRTVGGTQFVHFLGPGPPPFWDRRPKAELIAELWRNRYPVAGASSPGSELPAWEIEKHRQIRAVLKDLHGMTDAEIDKAIESLNDTS